MKNKLLEVLVCPISKGPLKYNKDKHELTCELSGLVYPVIDGKPIMLESKARDILSGSSCNSEKETKEEKFTFKKKLVLFIKKIFKLIRPSHTFKTHENKKRIPNLLSSLKDGDFALNIGAGETNYSNNLFNIDIETSKNIDVISDSRKLCIKSNSISLLISQAALEHIPETQLNLSEIERVIKKDGLLFIEVPFMQTYHAHPNDYFRFTHQGIKSYLDNFEILEEGISVGPASGTSLNLKIFLATLFSFGNKNLFVLMGIIFGWITYPIKFFDLFLERSPLAFYGASGIYVLARKKN